MADAHRNMPEASNEECRNWALDYVSDPSLFQKSNPRTWPVHSSGAAVDLTLRELGSKTILDMGTHFDDMRPISHSCALEVLLRGGKINESHPVLQNRRLLHWAMVREGFVNYPLEFWHFDWKNQMYIRNLREVGAEHPPAASYGYTEPPLER